MGIEVGIIKLVCVVVRGGQCGKVVEHIHTIGKVLGSAPSTANKNKN